MTMKVTLGNTIGASFLGTVAASILFGITILQVYVYYSSYPKDWRFQKISVGILMFLDTIHLALTVHAMYHYLIDEFGDLAAQQLIVWSFKLQIAVNVVIVVFVQCLYALRVWKLGKGFSKIWPLAVAVCVAAGIVIGIILAVETYRTNTFVNVQDMAWVVYASFASATAIDIAIATSMCYYLQKSRSGFSVTNNRIITIMRYVLISGFLTSACSLSALITYGTMHNLIWLGIEFLLTKLYINSYIAMLNSRNSIRDQESSSFSLSKIMNLRTGTTNHSESTNVVGDDKLDRDVMHLSSTYQTQMDDEYIPDSKKPRAESHALGITVHRTEERRYDNPHSSAV
ncbi:hypothetical protein B0H34DRAFT_803304 [Crassisporium funariophilum]|nr:hypothetical protein B0H34DRAFT_803304 [Crassisporium funariophilum]